MKRTHNCGQLRKEDVGQTVTLAGMKRTHNCGQLRKEDVGQTVTLAGWVDRRRDHGGVIFVDLRDKYGKTQIVFNPDYNADVMKTAEQLRNEYVITVTGKVYAREEGNTNEKATPTKSSPRVKSKSRLTRLKS